MQTGLFILFAFLIGAISSIYLPMNSSVARYPGSPHDPITLKKVLGASLFITGAIVSVS